MRLQYFHGLAVSSDTFILLCRERSQPQAAREEVGRAGAARLHQRSPSPGASEVGMLPVLRH